MPRDKVTNYRLENKILGNYLSHIILTQNIIWINNTKKRRAHFKM